jgi:hypothetical protein
MKIHLALLLGAACLQPAHAATDIYRWVDEAGRTHLSDVVPDRYKRSAVRVDPEAPEPTPAQRREAQARAARESQRAAAVRPDAAAVPAPGSLSVATPASAAPTGAQADCERARRRYRESQECFAPFRLANGAVRAEAFEHCSVVPDPSVACGLPRGH